MSLMNPNELPARACATSGAKQRHRDEQLPQRARPGAAGSGHGSSRSQFGSRGGGGSSTVEVAKPKARGPAPISSNAVSYRHAAINPNAAPNIPTAIAIRANVVLVKWRRNILNPWSASDATRRWGSMGGGFIATPSDRRPKLPLRLDRLFCGFQALRLTESLPLARDDDHKLAVDLSGKFPMLRIPADLEKGNKDRHFPFTPEFATACLGRRANRPRTATNLVTAAKQERCESP
jgi:hypothetical protein